MARTLTPLRVKIGLRRDGTAAYPAFNELPAVQASGMDWSRYVDAHGAGWLYDRVSGHRDDDDDSPYGQQWGVLLVPADFAAEAAAQFPDDCTVLTEAGLQDFYDTRVAVEEPEVVRDTDMLQGLKADMDLVEAALREAPDDAKLKTSRQSLHRQMKRALDPDDPAPGVRVNPRRSWSAHKARLNVEIG